jgi:hypothetical protein
MVRCAVKGESCFEIWRIGYDALKTWHEYSRVDVLKSWVGMVERGDWEVDGNGVACGMNIWKEADTEKGWERYVMLLSWH